MGERGQGELRKEKGEEACEGSLMDELVSMYPKGTR
jgi:hypothetical protein